MSPEQKKHFVRRMKGFLGNLFVEFKSKRENVLPNFQAHFQSPSFSSKDSKGKRKQHLKTTLFYVAALFWKVF